MGQSYSELALLKRGKMQEGKTEYVNPGPDLILVIPGRASNGIGFSSALCPQPKDSSSLGRICRCCHGCFP